MANLELENLFGVKGLVVVITGGGSGIGLMWALALEAHGAKVYIIGRRMETLQTAASRAKHGNIVPLTGDVTSMSSLQTIVDHITARDGYINLLLANSGITGPTLLDMPKDADISTFRSYLLDQGSEAFNSTLEVNTTGVFLTTVAFLELLDQGNKKGNVMQKSQVVATASIGGLHRQPLAGFAYSASKAAAIHLMKTLSTALIPYSIRSNVLAPGIFPSEMADSFLANVTDANGLLPQTLVPTQRAGNEEDMAGAALYLASRAGAYLNGNVLVVDGGRLGVLPATY